MGSKVMRCKFQLYDVTPIEPDKGANGNGPGVKVRMGAVFQPDPAKRQDPNDEDGMYGKASPHGHYECNIFNPHLVELLPKLKGRKFYIDFELAD